MYSIKFSHRYKKMPAHFNETFVTGVRKVQYRDLTQEFIEKDTALEGGGYYHLPPGELIVIDLWTPTISGEHVWQTVRPYNPEKFRFYQSLIGNQVGITITNEALKTSLK